jgi:hypothetical protein
MRRVIAGCLFLLVLGACHQSKEFARPTPDSLVLGQATRQDIETAYGRPYAERTNIVSAPPARSNGSPETASGRFTVLNYRYSDPAALFLAGASAGQKIIAFEFFNDRLYAYNFVSDVASDSSNFDERKVDELEDGKTTREDAITLLGPPTGRATFPAVAVAKEKLIYEYATGVGADRAAKRLELIFGGEKLESFRFVSRTGAPQPIYPNVTPVPIVVLTR